MQDKTVQRGTYCRLVGTLPFLILRRGCWKRGLVTENENTSLKHRDLIEMTYKRNDENVVANLIRHWIPWEEIC